MVFLTWTMETLSCLWPSSPLLGENLIAPKEVKKIDRWSKICKEASEQSKRNSIPVISNIMTLKELVKEEGIKIVCSTIEKENNLKKFLTEHKNYDKIIIVVGPEGGISSKEEEYDILLL